MSLLLFVIAALMLNIGYYITDKQLITPAVISSLVVAGSAFLGFLFEDEWNMVLHLETVIIVAGGLVFILIGNFGAVKLFEGDGNFDIKIKKYHIKNYFMIVYISFAAYLLYQFYININYFMLTLGNAYVESTDVLLKVREAKLEHNFEEPLGLMLATSINNCFFIVSCYCLSYNIIFCELKREDIKFIIPIVIYTVTSVLNAARIDFLGPFFYVISLSVTMLSYKYKPGVVIKKFIIYGGLASFLFLSWFLLLRYFRGGSFDPFDHLARYISGGIYCFDRYNIGEAHPFLYSNDFGAHIFSGFYKLLENFGYCTDITGKSSSADWVAISNFQCNVFSAFAPMIEDLGVIGCWGLLFIISFLMGGMQQFVFKGKIMGIGLIIFAETMSIFFMICVAEQFFTAHLTLSRLAHFILVYAFILLLEKWRK